MIYHGHFTLIGAATVLSVVRRSISQLLLLAVICAAALLFHKQVRADDAFVSDMFNSRYATSYGYDFCGNPEVGSQLRSLLQSLLRNCSLSAAEIQDIERRFEDTKVRIQNEIGIYEEQRKRDVENGKMPAPRQIFSGLFKCATDDYVNDVAKMKQALDLYSKGALTAAVIEPKICTRR